MIAPGERLFDGNPHGFASILCLHDLLFQAVEPDAGIKHFAYFAVLAYEDAAFGILCGVTSMDADALPFFVEHWAT
jgi:hypothetical protein